MNTAIEQLENNQVKVTVTVPAADVDKAIAAKYKEFANRANIPGFRKGKVPRPVIDNFFGGKESVMAAVTEDLINDTYPVASDEANVMAVARPQFPNDEQLVEQGKDYEYSATVEVQPEFELTSYDAPAITLPPTAPTAEQIDEEVEHMCSHYMSYEDAPADAVIEDENRVFMTISTTIDGKPYDTLTKDSFSYTVGAGLLTKEFDENIKGLKAGESKSFTIAVAEKPTGYLRNAAGMGTQANMDVTITSITARVKPELTDEWVKSTFDVDTVEEFRQRIAEMIQDDNEQTQPRLKEDRVCEVLRGRLTGEPTQAMIDDKYSELMQNFFNQLQRSNMTFDTYLSSQAMTREQFQDDVRKQAKDVCIENLALDAWAKHEGLTVSDAEVTEEFTKADPDNAAELEEDWRKNGQIHMIRQGILRSKALDDVIAKAEVTEHADEAAAPDEAEEPAAADTAAAQDDTTVTVPEEFAQEDAGSQE